MLKDPTRNEVREINGVKGMYSRAENVFDLVEELRTKKCTMSAE